MLRLYSDTGQTGTVSQVGNTKLPKQRPVLCNRKWEAIHVMDGDTRSGAEVIRKLQQCM